MYTSGLSSCKSCLFPSRIITKIVFVLFFFFKCWNTSLSLTILFFFFFPLCLAFLCVDFKAALKNLFSIAGYVEILKAKGVDSCICGFHQFASCGILEEGKL